MPRITDTIDYSRIRPPVEYDTYRYLESYRNYQERVLDPRYISENVDFSGIENRVRNSAGPYSYDDLNMKPYYTKGYSKYDTYRWSKPREIPEDEIDKLIREKKEETMFAARAVDGKWYLCIRRGRIIKGTSYPSGEDKDWIEFIFKNQKIAKACVNELNEKFWERYKDAGELSDELGEIAGEMVEVVKRYLST